MSLGRYGEGAALEHLKSKGMRLIERNWRHPLGEIDLIMLDRDVLVFVEVKTRSNWRYASRSLASSLSPEKRRRLSVLTESYLRRNYSKPGKMRRRIDFVGVLVDSHGLTKDICHYRAAI
jgi:putative endonuclease